MDAFQAGSKFDQRALGIARAKLTPELGMGIRSDRWLGRRSTFTSVALRRHFFAAPQPRIFLVERPACSAVYLD